MTARDENERIERAKKKEKKRFNLEFDAKIFFERKILLS